MGMMMDKKQLMDFAKHAYMFSPDEKFKDMSEIVQIARDCHSSEFYYHASTMLAHAMAQYIDSLDKHRSDSDG